MRQSTSRSVHTIILYAAAAVVLLVVSGCRTMTTGPVTGMPAPGRPAGSEWVVGTPITAYYHGPGGGHDRWGPLTHGMAKKLADGGFTLVWGSSMEDLDVAHAHGLRVTMLASQQLTTLVHNPPLSGAGALDDPARRPLLDALIEKARNHPAMYAWYVFDEPTTSEFPKIAEMVAYLRKHDPKHLAMVNLFPTYASAGALGTSGDRVTAYREHLRQYIDAVKPDLLSWDHYPFMKTHDKDDYFLNLELIREAAVKHGIPFLNVVQAVSVSEHSRVPTPDEGRYQAYTTLAYGGQGLSQFVYWAYSDFTGGISEFDDDNFSPARAVKDAAAPLTPLGEALRVIHPEFIAIARVLQPLKSLGVYHLGKLPPGTMPLPAGAAFTVDDTDDILVGYFGASDVPTHVLVVNLDYKAARVTMVNGPGPMEVFDAGTGKWRRASNGARAAVSLLPGGGKLLRLRASR